MGTVAPDSLPEDEIWLDVGNRCSYAEGVLDHHGSDSNAWSATQLVFQHGHKLSLRESGLTVVLHHAPDLDAICAAWLVRHLWERGRLPDPDKLQPLIQAVNESDQGIFRFEPESCFSVVFHRYLMSQARQGSEETRVLQGMELLDRTWGWLREGQSLENMAHSLMTPALEALFWQAREDYAQDLRQGQVFHLELPTEPPFEQREAVQNRPVDPPNRQEGGWQLIDMLFLDNPRSHLMVELARKDKRHSPHGQGFSLLLSCRSLRLDSAPELIRYTLSVDPLSGAHLQGLGHQLEKREQQKERERDLPLLPGRERLPDGRGRHGYNVLSPWYDGRGHHFTIVDSPALEIKGRHVCASRLSDGEVLEVLRGYGGLKQVEGGFSR